MTETPARSAAARADLCRLLAACFYEPGPEFAEERLFDSLREAAMQVDPDLAEHASAMGRSFEGTPLLDLRVEYTRLFLDPGGAVAPPYESAWIGGKDPAVAQESLANVVSFYSEAGFQIAEDFRDLPDHIAAELEFLYAAMYGEAAALASSDGGMESRARGLQRRFIESHLGRWAGPFCEVLRNEAQLPFYRQLAGLTERFLEVTRN